MLIPWRKVDSWTCLRCFYCCIEYNVYLGSWEAEWIARAYGVRAELTPRGWRLKRAGEPCPFLRRDQYGRSYCLINFDKPRACVSFPFVITRRPLKGVADRLAYYPIGRGEGVHVYIRDDCPGLGRGPPIEGALKKTLIKLGYLRKVA